MWRHFLAALTFSTLQGCALYMGGPEPVAPRIGFSRDRVVATFGQPIWHRQGKGGTECLLFESQRRTATGAPVSRVIEVVLTDRRVSSSAVRWPLQAWGMAGVFSPCD